MTTVRIAQALAVSLLLSATPAHAAEDHAGQTEKKAPTQAQARLERLKTLAGTWTGKAVHVSGQPMDATTVWSVTGGGSAVVETIFPGTPHEMMTVYTVDGGDLVLTHYCSAGNQPVMKAKPGGAADTIAFDFVRGGNMKPMDNHMHSAVITFVSDDALRTEWTSFDGGKPKGVAKFELTRKK
jgi:hypothetical protein